MGSALKTAGLLALVAAAFAGSVMLLRGGVSETDGEIRVLSRLDEYTLKSSPSIPNTIPGFLAQEGGTGVLPADVPAAPDGSPAEAAPSSPATGSAPASPAAPPPATPTTPPAASGTPPSAPAPGETASPGAKPTPDLAPEPIPVSAVQPLNEVELQKGFCAATLPRLVRTQYPGTYDSIPDDELEKSLLKLHPDYKGRICVLPVWFTANPHDIIKYEVRQDAAAIPNTVWIYSGLIAAAFGLVAVVVYRKVRPDAPPPPPPSVHRTPRLPVQKP
jgi:hypothetical protein